MYLKLCDIFILAGYVYSFIDGNFLFCDHYIPVVYHIIFSVDTFRFKLF